jgi:hypothetical protein
MTNSKLVADREILKKVFEIAGNNGWIEADSVDNKSVDTFHPRWLYGYIFSHDFARALWKNRKHCDKQDKLNDGDDRKLWYHDNYHLSEMAIADDPIKYLSDNI